jgi:hypothetical protein
MQRPAADPAKLLDAWMEWERGETPPGRVMSTLKTAGLRQLLETLAAESGAGVAVDLPDPTATDTWTPVV